MFIKSLGRLGYKSFTSKRTSIDLIEYIKEFSSIYIPDNYILEESHLQDIIKQKNKKPQSSYNI